jgi:hypothetical protein
MQSVRLMSLLFAQLIYVAGFQKMAINDHLLVFYEPEPTTFRYHCLSSMSQAIEEIQLKLTRSSLRSVAIGKRQTDSQMYFVAFGTVGRYQSDYIFYMTKVTIYCNLSLPQRRQGIGKYCRRSAKEKRKLSSIEGVTHNSRMKPCSRQSLPQTDIYFFLRSKPSTVVSFSYIR